jgi:hypothetical protein
MCALAVGITLFGCGDDESESGSEGGQGGQSGGSGGAGGSGGSGSDASTGGGGEGGDSQGSGGSVPWPGCSDTAHPDVPDPGDDECLQCLTGECCYELFDCGGTSTTEDDAGVSRKLYGCYDYFFDCTRSCFNREVATDASTDSDELLVQCGRECFAQFDYVRRDFLACAAGQPRPIVTSTSGEFIEGEPDPDAGTASNCIAECLPSWR